MTINPFITEGIELYPLITSGAFVEGRAIVAAAPDASGNQLGAQATEVGQSVTFTDVEKFLGVATESKATGLVTSVQRHGRRRAQGGGAITAPAFVTWDTDGKFVTYTHDVTKFGMIAGFAATDCSGDNAYFDMVIFPIWDGPANASGENLTLTGIITALTLAITGNATIGGTLGVTGNATFAARVLEKQGADVASTNNLVLGSDGNVFEITGATQINLLSNLTWQNGAVVKLLFTSTPTVKHATATSTTNITILLSGAVDFVAAAGDSLTLVLSESGGTQAWREVARKGQISTTAIVATTIAPSGNLTAGARVLHKQGADVASAGDLVLGSDGNVFEITGATQINHISNLTWQNGSEVTLLFTSTPTVDHANATSGTDITILLDGAVDFVAAAGDRLKLMLCEIGGTQAWRETGRVTVA